MVPGNFDAFTEYYADESVLISKIDASVEKAESSLSLCSNHERSFFLVNSDFMKLIKEDITIEGSDVEERQADLDGVRVLLTKLLKLMRSMRFMQDVTNNNVEFVASLKNFEPEYLQQMKERKIIIEMFERTVWLLHETIIQIASTLPKLNRKVEEVRIKYKKPLPSE